jgi:DNA invertase Pin-like site-specific DNA recombinase
LSLVRDTTGVVEAYKRRFVLYRRVSHAEQGRSGLGMEAQRRDLDLYLATQEGAEVVADFVEVASGGKSDRPVLAEALELCRKRKATLLVAKLDRLSRQVSFVANLLEDKSVEFVVASLPQASRFELHLYSALAEQERHFCSQRTKSALAEAKARGVKLGGARHHLPALNRAKQERVREEAEALAPLLLPLRQEGKSLRAVADHLNRVGLRTRTGKPFYAVKVAGLLKVLEEKVA